MADNRPKRLIEVDLPIRRISDHARREKSIRYGHIATLHLWWARRPLAACRAVVLGGLLYDPVDEQCPQSFRDGAMAAMNVPGLPGKRPNDDREGLRGALLDFIATFANWDFAHEPTYLDTARALVSAAYPEGPPTILDPFAGGGAIPLEALRVGAEAWASDLNPVAVLVERVVLEYLPRFGDTIAEQVRDWGEWIRAHAEQELRSFYPLESDGSESVGYLWARTVQCEGPGCGAQVPLVRSFWLSKKGAASEALAVASRAADGQSHFRIIRPDADRAVPSGTARRGSATCLACGYTTPSQGVKRQLSARRGGAQDARLMAIRCNAPSGRGWRLPEEADREAASLAMRELEERSNAWRYELAMIPDEPFPGHDTRAFTPGVYGIHTWGDLFSPRQALCISTFARLVREAPIKAERSLEVAVRTILALAVDRLADFNASMCVLNPTGGRGLVHVFGRQALAMVWDFMETNPFNDVAANWQTCIDVVREVATAERRQKRVGTVQRSDAASLPLPDAFADAVITDPPYYDAVPYADLSDFFYVWLKRSLGNMHPDLLTERLTPKLEEIVVNPASIAADGQKKLGPFFERQMARAFAECRRVLKDDAVAVVVFAHKSTSGWEAMLQALVGAGWTVTASWPIDTERPGRLRAQNSAALASSVHLVCRPRSNEAGVGDWGTVLRQLQPRVDQWMLRLAEEGVVGADAIFACLGPALELYSRYDRVETAAGQIVPLGGATTSGDDYLSHVWAAVARAALRTIFADAEASGFEPDSRLAAVWLWTMGSGMVTATGADGDDISDEIDEGESGGALPAKVAGFVLPYDTARKLAQPLGADLEALSRRAGAAFEVKGSTARMLPVRERRRVLLDGGEPDRLMRPRRGPQTELFAEEAAAIPYRSLRPGPTRLDRIHQSMLLFAEDRADALRRFLVDEGVGSDPLFWRLAQAFSALYPPAIPEKRWIDGVLARKRMLRL